MYNVAQTGPLWWAVPGVLAGMPRPFVSNDRRLNGGGALDAYNDDLPLLHAAGIRAVVSLLGIPRDAEVYASAGFDFISLPVFDGDAPTLEQTKAFLQFLNQQRGLQHPVAVHCEAGIGRTGTVLALYFIAQGHTAASAIQQVRAVEPRAIETARQIQFLQQFEALVQAATKPV